MTILSLKKIKNYDGYGNVSWDLSMIRGGIETRVFGHTPEEALENLHLYFKNKSMTNQELSKKPKCACGVTGCGEIIAKCQNPEIEKPKIHQGGGGAGKSIIIRGEPIIANSSEIPKCSCGGIIETHQGNNGFPDSWYCMSCDKDFEKNPFKVKIPNDSKKEPCKCLKDFNCLCSKEYGCQHCKPHAKDNRCVLCGCNQPPESPKPAQLSKCCNEPIIEYWKNKKSWVGCARCSKPAQDHIIDTNKPAQLTEKEENLEFLEAFLGGCQGEEPGRIPTARQWRMLLKAIIYLYKNI